MEISQSWSEWLDLRAYEYHGRTPELERVNQLTKVTIDAELVEEAVRLQSQGLGKPSYEVG